MPMLPMLMSVRMSMPVERWVPPSLGRTPPQPTPPATPGGFNRWMEQSMGKGVAGGDPANVDAGARKKGDPGIPGQDSLLHPSPRLPRRISSMDREGRWEGVAAAASVRAGGPPIPRLPRYPSPHSPPGGDLFNRSMDGSDTDRGREVAGGDAATNAGDDDDAATKAGGDDDDDAEVRPGREEGPTGPGLPRRKHPLLPRGRPTLFYTTSSFPMNTGSSNVLQDVRASNEKKKGSTPGR